MLLIERFNSFCLKLGHCAEKFPENVTLRVGSNLKDEGGQIVEVSKILVHPNFENVSFNYDFALLKFIKMIAFDQNIQPADLPNNLETNIDGTSCVVSGWGKMENGEKPRNLKSLIVRIVDSALCQRSYNTSQVKFHITSYMMCASAEEDQEDACSGDSVSFITCSENPNRYILVSSLLKGGPLFCDAKLVGVVSAGLSCGLKNYPGIYSRVSAIRQWIRQTCGV